MTERARSFGAVAAGYDRARPGYPQETVRWALPFVPCRAADVGAGTGKLTEVLVALACDVVAVEPDDAMRARIVGAEARSGTAEALPLPDGSVDAVLAAQAYHWFEPERFLGEAARVLCPGGTVALLWNVLDDRVEWVAELAGLLEAYDRLSLVTADESPPFGGRAAFGEPELRREPHSQPLDERLLLELVSTRSRTLTIEAPAREQLLSAVSRLVQARHGEGVFELPYVTEAWRAARH